MKAAPGAKSRLISLKSKLSGQAEETVGEVPASVKVVGQVELAQPDAGICVSPSSVGARR